MGPTPPTPGWLTALFILASIGNLMSFATAVAMLVQPRAWMGYALCAEAPMFIVIGAANWFSLRKHKPHWSDGKRALASVYLANGICAVLIAGLLVVGTVLAVGLLASACGRR